MASYSHPDKLLVEHLDNVAKESERKILEKKLSLKWPTLEIAQFAYYIGKFHDFGKFTKYFQEYIQEKDEKKKAKLKANQKTQHGPISALFSYYCFKHVLKFDENVAMLSFFIIKKHHGNLTQIKSEISNIQHDIETLKEQAKSVDNNEVNGFYRFKDNFDITNFRSFLEDKELIFKLENLARSIEDEDMFLLNNLLFSVLIDTDKKDAGDMEEFKRLKIEPNIVDLYREESFDLGSKDSLNILRNNIYNKVMEETNFGLTTSILSITAPTGTGKTLTSLSYALKLRNKIEEAPRIIYCLPFTSIIDQNYTVIKDVLTKRIPDYVENQSRYLIKHHHLSDIAYKAENENKPIDESLMYVESWNSEIIVTTFVQLFDTLLGNMNRSLKKFHNIANSIILIDEVQNIPIKYWMLIDYVFGLLSKKMGCKIVLLTATKPLIFDESESKELLIKLENDGREYFEHEELNRTKLEININEKLDIKQFFDKVDIPKLMKSNNSVMFVFNTIQSSLDFYDMAKDNGFFVEYLSSNIIPSERRKRIDGIKDKIKSNEKLILVTTQLVEAGVDLDFDAVFRDMAPIDSIIQVAGRCNRNNKKQQSRVSIYNLIDKRGKEYSNYIYQDLILMAKQVLDKKDIIEEKDFFALIDNYFKLTKQKKSQDSSKDLITQLKKLVYFLKDKQGSGIESLADFKLIDDLPGMIDVFIEVDEEAANVWAEYSKLYLIEDRIKRKKEFLNIKNKIRDYIISVHKKFLNDFNVKDETILRIPLEMKEQYYDEKTGFIRKNEDIASFI